MNRKNKPFSAVGMKRELQRAVARAHRGLTLEEINQRTRERIASDPFLRGLLRAPSSPKNRRKAG